MNNGPPPGVTVRDLRPLYEAFSEEDDEQGNPIFLYSSFGFITDDFHAYFGQSDLRKRHLSPEDIRKSLRLLPDHDVYPEAPLGITVLSSAKQTSLFVKGPMLNIAFLGTRLLPKLTRAEVETLELLEQHPHPHIVRYRGCLLERGRIVGIAFEHHSETLFERLERAGNFDTEACLRSITSAIAHLHSLGLAHNDLNPSNIMVDEADACYLIDFGSCQPFGNDLITAGSRGWVEDEYLTSAQEHDGIALGKIRTWLDLQGQSWAMLQES